MPDYYFNLILDETMNSSKKAKDVMRWDEDKRWIAWWNAEGEKLKLTMNDMKMNGMKNNRIH